MAYGECDHCGRRRPVKVFPISGLKACKDCRENKDLVAIKEFV